MEVLARAGIRVHKEGTGKGTGRRAVVEVGFHSFRHTWVTTSAEAGVDPATVRAIVGWGSPAMERVYTHVSEEHLRSAMAKRPSLAEATGAPSAAPARHDFVADVDGMCEADLESLLAAITRRLKGVGTGA